MLQCSQSSPLNAHVKDQCKRFKLVVLLEYQYRFSGMMSIDLNTSYKTDVMLDALRYLKIMLA